MKHLQRLFHAFAAVAALLAASSALAQPSLFSVDPVNGATGVASSTTVVFTFNMDMDTSSEAALFQSRLISGGSLLPLVGVTFSWTGARTLEASRSGGFPADSIIAWQLFGSGFSDEDGFPMLSNPSGSFSTGAGGGGGGTGPATISLSYHVSYDQFTAGAPTLATSNIYTFFADAQAPATRNLTTATVTPPGGSAQTMFGVPFIGPTNFLLGVTSNSLPQLQASFPVGNYAFSLQASGSNQLISVNLPNSAFPAAPTISNYVAAQSIAPGAAFTLLFNAGGVASDFVFLHIEEEQTAATIFESPDFGRPGAFTGASNHVVISAGLIQAGKSYGVTIERWVATTNLTAGYSSTSGYGTTTHSRLVSPAIILLSSPVRSGGTFTLQARVNATNQTYVLERSSNLTNWSTVNSTVITTTNLTPLTDSNPNNPFFFYRVRKQ